MYSEFRLFFPPALLLNTDWCKIKENPCHFRSCAGIDVVVSAPALEFLDDEPASNAEVNFFFILVPGKNQEEIKNLEKKLMESNDIGAQIRKELEALEKHVDGVVLFLFLSP